MTQRTLARAAALLALAGLPHALALAQDGGRPEPAEKPLLSGPPVTEENAEDSLVRRGYDGAMQRLEIPVAEAAVNMLDLTGEEREAVDRILTERAALMDGLVVEHLLLVNNLRGLREMEPQERRETMGRLREAFAPVLESPPLEAQLAGVLSEEHRAEFEAHIAEYRAAQREQAVRRLRDRQGEMAPDGMGGPGLFGAPEGEPAGEADGDGERRRDRLRERFAGPGGRGPGQWQELLIEIRRSAERVVGGKRDRFEMISRELALTPEQEARVQAIFQANAGSGGGPEDRAGRFRLLRELGEVLNDEQRAKLRELARSGGLAAP